MNQRIMTALFIRAERELQEGAIKEARRTLCELFDIQQQDGYVSERFMQLVNQAL